MTSKIMPTYNRKPVTFTRGEGIYLYDSEGKQYLDALCGLAVTSLGHSHPLIAETVSKQSAKLIHTSNAFHIESQEKLAKRLCQLTGMENVFFCNSGAESVEAAIKIARKYGNDSKIDNPKIIVMENSFHGRTLAALSATGGEKAHNGFYPLIDGLLRVPYNNIEAIDNLAKNNNIVGILLEPIQGEGGIKIPNPEYLSKLRTICDANSWLLMIDEVQSGFCRTGKWFAYQNFGIIPDIVTSAKGLGNGVPIGACMGNQKVSKLFEPGSHGSTFGGNPFVSTISLEVLKIIKERNLLDHVNEMGKFFINQLKDDLGNLKIVREIRGMGLMIGIELKKPNLPVVKDCLEKQNLLLNLTSSNIVRMLPPLIIKKEQLKTISKKLKFVLESYE